ncbi:FadR family transcriptional regulator [Jiangella ureilytica]|uniref:FadR family transcriptional regulator n=1 Tax=Jiangella ureilytica TaxID=2530374 RepID=A0A4R4RBB2_9ACTN|nr:FadR/GntR family transcriptional regulator [Jiangella ureilytica]TDC46337.1 FadR family transcriptional regulator [Jiangella ureilytica]
MTMAEDIAELVLQSIVDGALPPGATLPPEADLAEKFGASRLTVREAVRILRTQNVVRINRGRGTQVNPTEDWTSLDAVMRVSAGGLGSTAFVAARLLEARRMIEVGAVQLAADRRTDADLAELEATIARMREAGERDDLEAVVDADLRFHAVVMRASGNPFVPLLFDSIGPLLVQTRRQTSSVPGIRRAALRHHQAILGALRHGDAHEARLAMERHLSQMDDDLRGAAPAV